MTFGCGNSIPTTTGNENNSEQPVTGPGGGGSGQVFRIFAVDTAGALLSFQSDNPLVIQGKATPTGLPAGERLTAIDFRPSTGVLYGITNTGKLHYIDKSTAQCFLVGNGLVPGLAFSNDIDFNPVADVMRQVSGGQNSRVNASAGILIANDPNLNISGTPVTGGCATAYTNSFAGATSTRLFTMDSATNRVYAQNLTTGNLTSAVPLPFTFASNAGFDIAPNNLGFIAATPAGANQSQLLTFDPGSGTVLPLGGIGGGVTIQSIAVEISPPAVTNFVGIDDNNNLVRFRSTSPQTLASSVAITGLGVGEVVRGCDFRPGLVATGTAFTAANGTHVLTVDAGGTGRLYQVNLTSGVATLLSTGGGGVTIGNITETGIDFNPTNDLLRIANAVSTGANTTLSNTTTQNFSVVPNTGATTTNTDFSYPAADPGFDGDGVEPNFGPFAPAAAYTQNFLGSRATRLFLVDTRRDTLCRVGTPISGGVLTTMGGLSIDASHVTGLDIEASDRAWLVTAPVISSVNGTEVVANQSVLCRVNLNTGQADPVSNIGGRVLRDFAALPPGI
jgi:hypothetical protein